MLKYTKNLFNKYKQSNSGFIALLIVIMVTSLIIVSSVIIALINTSNSLSNYQVSESVKVASNIDACMDDALWRIASSSTVTGSYFINTTDVVCEYQISGIMNGYKFVTSTATSTSSVGNWNRQVVARVSVSTTPISIYSYQDNIGRYNAGTNVCGDGVREDPEVCDDGNNDIEVCGDGVTQNGDYCNDDCSAILTMSEVCDDDNAVTESCGDWEIQNGSYCNATCSAVLAMTEICEFTESSYYCSDSDEWCGDCMDEAVSCPGKEVIPMYLCHDCQTNKTNCTVCP